MDDNGLNFVRGLLFGTAIGITLWVVLFGIGWLVLR